MSDHLDGIAMVWFDYGTTTPYTTSIIASPRVLGTGSSMLSMDANKHIWNDHNIAYIKGGKYTVWSIHTYTEETVEDGEFYGEIIAEYGGCLGQVYFRQNQWTCSYGMRFVPGDLTIRLAFRTLSNAKTFYIADYQIVQFDDLASANSFVNSREFVSYSRRDD